MVAGSEVLLDVRSLVKHFPITKGFIIQRQVGAVKAVDGVSLTIRRGETLGLVGESGCGKTTLGRVILRLMEPTSGEAYFEGRNIFKLTKEELRRLRRDMQIIFQDPYSSLNPRMTVGDIIGEPLEIHNLAHGKEKVRRVAGVPGGGRRSPALHSTPTPKRCSRRCRSRTPGCDGNASSCRATCPARSTRRRGAGSTRAVCTRRTVAGWTIRSWWITGATATSWPARFCHSNINGAKQRCSEGQQSPNERDPHGW